MLRPLGPWKRRHIFSHSLSERSLAWKPDSSCFHLCLQCLALASFHLSPSSKLRKGMRVWSDGGRHVFQACRQPQTLLGVSTQHEASKDCGRWTWKKTPVPSVHGIQPQGGKDEHALSWATFWPGCCVTDHHAASRSLVRYLLVTTRWHCRLKWNTANLLPAPRWGSGIPHLGIKKMSRPIYSFYRWLHWGLETK